MGIKRVGLLYEITPPRAYRGYSSVLSEPGLVTLAGETFAVARWSFTGNWYAYDLQTGEELCSFPREFYDKFIRPLRFEDLSRVPDLTLTRAANGAT